MAFGCSTNEVEWSRSRATVRALPPASPRERHRATPTGTSCWCFRRKESAWCCWVTRSPVRSSSRSRTGRRSGMWTPRSRREPAWRTSVSWRDRVTWRSPPISRIYASAACFPEKVPAASSSPDPHARCNRRAAWSGPAPQPLGDESGAGRGAAAGSGKDIDSLVRDGLAALRAAHPGDELRSASAVAEPNRRALFRPDPPVAPGGQGHEHGHQVAAGVGERVLVAGRALAVPVTFNDAVVDQRVQTGRQQVSRDLEVVGELVEARQAQVKVSQDERRPPVANHLEASGHGAVHAGKACLPHGPQHSGLTD